MRDKQSNNKISYFDMQFITSGISIMLVLLLLGMAIFFVLTAKNLTVYVRENVNFSILVNDDMKEADIIKYQKELEKKSFVKSAIYISKQQALKEQTEAMGTNPKDFLGYNPFKASIEINLRSDYANSDSIAKIEKTIKKKVDVQDVLYQKELIDVINDNIRTISLMLLGLAIVLTYISFALIKNTIRLAIYSKRFLIHTMTLVGADRKFIRRPFIRKNIWSGIFAAGMASIFLTAGAYGLISYEPELIRIITLQVMGIVVISIILFGLIIPWWCSYVSINKFLYLKSEELYYI
ncbi:Cell division protein FtsX [termite gut metagenome]|uniref:Cell division protein FtsX n=1 Tax=termite gut metagenome TaxID=433724 RepID=A0A5J4RY43_9ZZZZ